MRLRAKTRAKLLNKPRRSWNFENVTGERAAMPANKSFISKVSHRSLFKRQLVLYSPMYR